jgi:glycosyltransferase involved in cell wall biosynthesis
VNQRRTLLLLSGLPLNRKPSFHRQLVFLAEALRARGWVVVLGGPVFIDSGSPIEEAAEGAENTWSGEAASRVCWSLADSVGDPLPFADVLSRTDPEAVIALGYPDQFPFLRNAPQATRPLCYLWSQFSRPPRRALPEAATYIPLTEKTAAHLRAAGCSRIGPIIPHGVDPGLFAPLPDTKRRRSKAGHGFAHTFVVGTVANNSRRKRLDLIIRSFALFFRQHLFSRLLIKTDRPVSLDGVDLPALIGREKVEDRIQLILGDLTDRQMAALYNRMDLYLNLSEWEGFCIPVIEAMACAVPVLSPPIQGPGEILPYSESLVADGTFREEEGAQLYQADPEAVCRVVKALAADRGLRERLGRAGREAVRSRYDLKRVAEQWERVLQMSRP